MFSPKHLQLRQPPNKHNSSLSESSYKHMAQVVRRFRKAQIDLFVFGILNCFRVYFKKISCSTTWAHVMTSQFSTKYRKFISYKKTSKKKWMWEALIICFLEKRKATCRIPRLKFMLVSNSINPAQLKRNATCTNQTTKMSSTPNSDSFAARLKSILLLCMSIPINTYINITRKKVEIYW